MCRSRRGTGLTQFGAWSLVSDRAALVTGAHRANASVRNLVSGNLNAGLGYERELPSVGYWSGDRDRQGSDCARPAKSSASGDTGHPHEAGFCRRHAGSTRFLPFYTPPADSMQETYNTVAVARLPNSQDTDEVGTSADTERILTPELWQRLRFSGTMPASGTRGRSPWSAN